MKGKEKPVPVFELTSSETVSIKRQIGTDRTIHSDLVGRNKELSKLELQVLKAVNGEGSIVNVIGEGGIGKSRLIAELKEHQTMKGITVLEGRAISMGRNLSFYPIIGFLKDWARITENDLETVQLEKLSNLVGKIHPEEKDEIVPFVATLVGLKLTGTYADRVKGIEGKNLERLIFKNLREFLLKASDSHPLIIILDDMHWSDTSSIDLLDVRFRLVQNQKLLFINVFRPHYEETSDRLIHLIQENHADYSVDLSLDPLSEQESDALINNLM